MKLIEIISALEELFPLKYQESYDNSGLQAGNPATEVHSALLCLDLTESVVEEAIHHHCDLVISHHPLLFNGLKSITGKTAVERIVIKAIQKKIAVYSVHTNADNQYYGVSNSLAKALRLQQCKVLRPSRDSLRKLITFCPSSHTSEVREALFKAGAGHIGNYDACSSNNQVTGTFRAGDNTNPFVGKKGEIHFEEETRIEVVFPVHLQNSLIAALIASHPYEEVAYDVYKVENNHPGIGAGIIGKLPKPLNTPEFLNLISQNLHQKILRYSGKSDTITTVACCGGSGAFLIPDAKASNADAMVTGDLKYHDFDSLTPDLLLVDAGHYETEQWIKHKFAEILNEKFPTFATRISEADQGLMKYYINL